MQFDTSEIAELEPEEIMLICQEFTPEQMATCFMGAPLIHPGTGEVPENIGYSHDTVNKAFAAVVADAFGPHFAQALYHFAVMVTRIA